MLEREILKLNYTHKTLDALAGGDDKIFVILDDRDDVWLKEGYLPSENLLKIPAYFYHDDKQQDLVQKAWFEKMIRDCWKTFDFDLTLLIYLKHLIRIHTQFFTDYEGKIDELRDSKFYIKKLKNQVFGFGKVVSFEKLVP